MSRIHSFFCTGPSRYKVISKRDKSSIFFYEMLILLLALRYYKELTFIEQLGLRLFCIGKV